MTYPASVWMVEKKYIAISTGCLKLAYYPSLSRYQQLWSCFHTPNDHESIFYRFFSGSMSTNGYIIVGLGPGCFGFLLSPYERDWIPNTVYLRVPNSNFSKHRGSSGWLSGTKAVRFEYIREPLRVWPVVGCVEAREVGELEWWWMFSMVKSSCSLLPSCRNSKWWYCRSHFLFN